MATNTIQQIENINNSLKWIQKHKPEDYGQRFLQLVEERRKLKKIAEAEKEKPSIAAYGESQMGKSYLIGNLLQKQKFLDSDKDKAIIYPFMVLSEQDEAINFVDRINPIGNKKEATGVVTRFTPFNTETGAKRYNKEHPVIVKLLSVANIATVLCDSYTIDVKFRSGKPYSDENLKNISENIFNQYKDKPEVAQNFLVEDDILDIKNYLDKFVPNYEMGRYPDYFNNLAFVIRRVPIQEWVSVLKYLWHENPDVTALFQRLFNALQKLGFAKEVYVNFDAVMHKGDNKNTIMSVDCLNGLDDKSWSLVTDVFLSGNGKVSDFPKCELCALCAETIFKVEEDYMSEEAFYHYEDKKSDTPGYMWRSTYDKLGHTGVKKDLLKDTDLLDFPGAKPRLSIKEEFLSNVEDATGASNLVQMLLRGKVAFLFNNYSESRIINILLFCHDSSAPAVNGMYITINDWIEKYVGDSPEHRLQTVKRCDGVPPLFVIGTKFNIDMIEEGRGDQDSENGLNNRWYGRFIKVLYTNSFKAESVQWFKNWDGVGNTFKNTFLLRDFKYSGCDGKGNNLYEGYDEKSGNLEKKLHLSDEFYNRLRSTFVSNPNVKMFFEKPDVSWDVAATLKNDGALYIIDKLSVVSKRMGENRREQFCEETKKIAERVSGIMRQYYVSDDTSELLDENIRKADEIFREMDFACQHRPEYFGHLLSELQLSEPECFKYLHSIIPTLNSTVNDPKADYELIRKRCRLFEGCRTDSDKWNVLINAYRFTSQDEAEKYLSDKNIKVEDLFKGEYVKRTNSAVIADGILKMWQKRFTTAALRMSDNGTDITMIDTPQMNYLIDCLIGTMLFVKLADKIESTISPFVDILDYNTINEYFVADMIASKVSDFVTDFGYSYLTDEQINNVKRICNENHLPCYNYMDKERQEYYEEEQATELFDNIVSLSECFTPAYQANYNCWLEYMYVAFVANLNVPEYDHEANDELKKLLEEIKK